MSRADPRRAALPVLWLAWWLLASWSLPAAAATFGQNARGYDLDSLAWAVGVACVGGVASTLVKLRSARVLVLSALVEALLDCGVAAVAGVLVYLASAAWSATRAPVPFDVTVVALFLAGFARGAFFILLTRAGARLSAGAVDAALATIARAAPAPATAAPAETAADPVSKSAP